MAHGKENDRCSTSTEDVAVVIFQQYAESELGRAP